MRGLGLGWKVLLKGCVIGQEVRLQGLVVDCRLLGLVTRFRFGLEGFVVG